MSSPVATGKSWWGLAFSTSSNHSDFIHAEVEDQGALNCFSNITLAVQTENTVVAVRCKGYFKVNRR